MRRCFPGTAPQPESWRKPAIRGNAFSEKQPSKPVKLSTSSSTRSFVDCRHRLLPRLKPVDASGYEPLCAWVRSAVRSGVGETQTKREYHVSPASLQLKNRRQSQNVQTP